MKKELYKDYFENKKVTVLGLGLLGRGIGDTEFLIQEGANVICTDTRSQEKLAESIAYITKDNPSNLQLIIGENRFQDFENIDYVLTCAGMPLGYEYLEYAKKHAVPVYMSAALVSSIIMSRLEGVTIIGITGTRGKSTTTQMIAHVLRCSGAKVHCGGNIRGIANLPLLRDVEEGDFLVLELDSWQLQGFGDMKISPHIAVFTSFMDDHMNYYKNDREAYFNDKANIYRNQSKYDVLVASPQAATEITKYDKKVSFVIPEDIHFATKLIGEHNQVSARLTHEVAMQCGLDQREVSESIASFSPVEGRLEDMGIFGEKHVRVFNDNNATTADATIAAISAINDTYNKKPIIIAGGADKGLPVETLEDVVIKNTKKQVLLEGTGTSRLTRLTGDMYPTLTECIQEAFSLAEEGDIILFSPGFASFSKEFNNEYERNDVFVNTVKKYL